MDSKGVPTLLQIVSDGEMARLTAYFAKDAEMWKIRTAHISYDQAIDLRREYAQDMLKYARERGKHFKRVSAQLMLDMGMTVSQVKNELDVSKDWITRLIKSKETIRPDKRRRNAKPRTKGSDEVVAFVVEKLRADPFDEWTGAKVASMVSGHFKFDTYGERKGREVLAQAKKIIRRPGGS